jgi:hypothetical protein
MREGKRPGRMVHTLIPTLGRLKEEDHAFETSLDYIVGPFHKIKIKSDIEKKRTNTGIQLSFYCTSFPIFFYIKKLLS